MFSSLAIFTLFVFFNFCGDYSASPALARHGYCVFISMFLRGRADATTALYCAPEEACIDLQAFWGRGMVGVMSMCASIFRFVISTSFYSSCVRGQPSTHCMWTILFSLRPNPLLQQHLRSKTLLFFSQFRESRFLFWIFGCKLTPQIFGRFRCWRREVTAVAEARQVQAKTPEESRVENERVEKRRAAEKRKGDRLTTGPARFPFFFPSFSRFPFIFWK